MSAEAGIRLALPGKGALEAEVDDLLIKSVRHLRSALAGVRLLFQCCSLRWVRRFR